MRLRWPRRGFSTSPSDDIATESPDPLNSATGAAARLWPVSAQYSTLAGEGHRRPPPALGAPSLIWHVGIWPKQMAGDHDVSKPSSKATHTEGSTRKRPTINEELFKEQARKFDAQNVKFFSEVSGFLVDLQRRGRVSVEKELEFVTAEHQTGHLSVEYSRLLHDFKVCQPQSLNFTIWWRDEASLQQKGTPSPTDLRVRIHAQTFVDHATITFYIDAGKPWNEEPVHTSASAVGARRKRIFQIIEQFREVASKQIQNGAIHLAREPEHGVTPDLAARTMEGTEYLFEGIWNEFLATFAINTKDRELKSAKRFLGEIFAESRGIIMSTPGLESGSQPEAEANVGVGRFAVFNEKTGEANTIIKAHWPFIRRMSYRADDRDFVACGILDWRALLITPLGSSSDAPITDEAAGPGWSAPSLCLPERDAKSEAAPRATRFLLLTKGEPHRQQIGRFVERIVAIETLRLFALRNWAIVRNSSVLIRLLGRELDAIGSIWSDGRQRIENDYWARQDVINKDPSDDHIPLLRRISVGVSARDLRQLPSKRQEESRDQRTDELNDLIGQVEPLLISLTASLDKIGQGGAGRLLYLLNRSRTHIEEFERLAKMLEIGNIDTWINYQQFVDRGLKPTFAQIENTFEMLVSLRQRIQSITDIVQTSALIIEAEATHENTKTLRKIAQNWWKVETAIVVIIAALLFRVLEDHAQDAWDALYDFFWSCMALLPTHWFSAIQNLPF